MIDLAAAGAWLGCRLEFEATVASGTSKDTLRVRADGAAAILACGPSRPGLPSAHDLNREWRFLSVLEATAVPVPHLLGYCPDASVAGAPFLLTAAVDGVSLSEAVGVAFDAAALSRQAVDILATLHGLDRSDPRLAPPPGRYLERQIRRWGDQLSRTATAGRLGPLAPIEAWLLEHLPGSEERTIIHGDFGFHNLLVTPDAVVAVLDWELATVGDPLSDLVGLLKAWGPAALSSNPANQAVASAPGALSAAELEARYGTLTGRSFAGQRRFYDVFSLWRSIGIQEGVHARSGGTRLVEEVPALVGAARALVGEGALGGPARAPRSDPGAPR